MNELNAVTTSGAVLGAVLVKLRTLQGMKQGDLAEAVGVGASTWSRIEKGESGLSIDQLRLAAKALGQTAGRILEIAEAAEQEAIKKGINVEPLGTSSKVFTNAALGASLGGVIPVLGTVLGGLIGGAIVSYLKQKSDDASEQ